MLKSELVSRVLSRNLHFYRRDAERIINTMFDEITAALARGDRVELWGFGVFLPKARNPRIGRNPRTGAKVSVAEKKVPSFKPGKEMRARIIASGR